MLVWTVMLGWAGWTATLLGVALIAALFGFGGVVSTAVAGAQICFFFFLVVYLTGAVARVVGRS